MKSIVGACLYLSEFRTICQIPGSLFFYQTEPWKFEVISADEELEGAKESENCFSFVNSRDPLYSTPSRKSNKISQIYTVLLTETSIRNRTGKSTWENAWFACIASVVRVCAGQKPSEDLVANTLSKVSRTPCNDCKWTTWTLCLPTNSIRTHRSRKLFERLLL